MSATRAPRRPDPSKIRAAAQVRAARISGVSDERVLAAVARVPRSGFVADEYVDDADRDSPLPIGHGQTTSQPSLIAAMVECLDIGPDDTVLEVGSGYGYQTALLSLLARYVYSMEIIEDLAIHAQRNLEAFGAANVDVVVGDGSLGLPEFAPYTRSLSVPPSRKSRPHLRSNSQSMAASFSRSGQGASNGSWCSRSTKEFSNHWGCSLRQASCGSWVGTETISVRDRG